MVLPAQNDDFSPNLGTLIYLASLTLVLGLRGVMIGEIRPSSLPIRAPRLSISVDGQVPA